jgi:hypothetical protein
MATAWSLSYSSDSVAKSEKSKLGPSKADRETYLNSDHPELERVDRRAMSSKSFVVTAPI